MTTDRLDHRLFTALLAHDISNSNQTTRGYLEMLLNEQMGPLDDEQRRVLTTCLRQCHRVQSVIDAVRLLEDVAGTEPRPEPQDLDAAVRESIEIVQKRYSDRDVRVRFSPAQRSVLAEPALPTVFIHLLDNAARHNDCEIVEVDLALTRTEGEPPLWEISVTDNGGGVPRAKREGLFSRLAHGEVHGAGIGLAVVHALLQRWGGWIRLEDTPAGQGASFTLALPAA